MKIFVYKLANLQSTVREYHDRISRLEAEKIDLEYEVARKEFEARFTQYNSFIVSLHI